ncbi:zf-PARP-domain-containing protein [Patellaria atrata CBS 101060]|uniref:Zf-PARP-domain-containing protein n=1 Tax=Patellaria atrata CBS 101060 TaxID=1346257 RepID=A0A9P4SIR9_9PEZI|nr:zf-PARP-domain-containing protein [Patellaria atrata CBS 101060]
MPTSYRIEVSPNNRAGCNNAACKKDKIKIKKGEIRFGTLVTIMDHTSWQWRHWGCLSPQVIENVNKFIEGDFEIFDGFEELSSDIQEKVRKALEQGHVDDEEWNGDVELNRPGKKGFKVPASKKRKGGDEDEEDEEDAPAPKKRAKGKKQADEVDEKDDEPAPKARGHLKKAQPPEDKPVENKSKAKPNKSTGKEETAAKKSKAKPKKTVAIEEDDDAISEVEQPAPKSKRAKSSKKSAANVKDDNSADEIAEEAPAPMSKAQPKAKSKKAAGNEKAPPQKRGRKSKKTEDA